MRQCPAGFAQLRPGAGHHARGGHPDQFRAGAELARCGRDAGGGDPDHGRAGEPGRGGRRVRAARHAQQVGGGGGWRSHRIPHVHDWRAVRHAAAPFHPRPLDARRGRAVRRRRVRGRVPPGRGRRHPARAVLRANGGLVRPAPGGGAAVLPVRAAGGGGGAGGARPCTGGGGLPGRQQGPCRPYGRALALRGVGCAVVDGDVAFTGLHAVARAAGLV